MLVSSLVESAGAGASTRRGCINAGVPAPRRAVLARAAARDADSNVINFKVHGRHVDVTEEVESFVINRLNHSLTKFMGAEYLESEGGVKEVDVRLMNSQAEVTLRPRHLNKELHDTFLRQGEMKALGFGSDMASSFEAAAAELEKKLHKWSKAAPKKKDYRSFKRAAGST